MVNFCFFVIVIILILIICWPIYDENKNKENPLKKLGTIPKCPNPPKSKGEKATRSICESPSNPSLDDLESYTKFIEDYLLNCIKENGLENEDIIPNFDCNCIWYINKRLKIKDDIFRISFDNILLPEYYAEKMIKEFLDCIEKNKNYKIARTKRIASLVTKIKNGEL